MPGRSVTGQVVNGSALSFNGTTQYAGSTTQSTVTDNLTMCAWVKPSSFPNAQNMVITNGENDGNGYGLYIASDGTIRLDIAFVASLNSAQAISAGVWSHVAVVRSGGTWQCYLNGVAVGGTIGNNPNGPGARYCIGAGLQAAGTTNRWFAGAVDDARFYERALSASELLAIYNRGININNPDVSSANLKFWHKFEEGSGTSAASSGSSSNTLTLVNTPTWVTGQVQVSNVPARTAAGARSAAGARVAA